MGKYTKKNSDLHVQKRFPIGLQEHSTYIHMEIFKSAFFL